MRQLVSRAEAVLRGRSSTYPWTLLVLCGLVYGSVMGAFGGLIWQVVYSAVKVPLLLLATLLLSLPSYLVMNTLLGLRGDIAEAVRAIAGSQATVTIVLVALAPLTVLWYASSADYYAAILFNAAMFAVASLAAQIVLARAYRPLIARSPRHRWLLRTWIVLYAFVGIQMGWSLRPFIGSPGAPVQFFRSGAGENAYVVVARMIVDVWAR
ncbi:hypothetical protein SAMN05444166_5584 [Singulisphaera sp. GP187]|uniref:hypothetical protein n=1 Tax=Singulisphaera sp. GP187 TaxID=1882752 RepID=UPI00092ADD54|nr:hypothetical protein [Singulisphaera sp. GP187]SIO58180.1 hypothetical protein SAMN05444166_5584 [Singulisphaera sp. GP187]